MYGTGPSTGTAFWTLRGTGGCARGPMVRPSPVLACIPMQLGSPTPPRRRRAVSLFADMDAIFGQPGATSGPAELLTKQQEAAADQVG